MYGFKIFAVLCLFIIPFCATQHDHQETPGHIHVDSLNTRGHLTSKYFAQKLIRQFSNKTEMKIKDFETMLAYLERQNIQESNSTCSKASEMLKAIEKEPGEDRNITKSFLIDVDHMITVCPVLFYHIATKTSFSLNESACEKAAIIETRESRLKIWFYATIALIGISLCGLFGVIVIPIVNKNYYFYVLQFFMALAVGTLVGDALLHLLPHSMRTTNDNQTPKELQEMMMHRGIASILGILVFCLIEKLLSFITKSKNQTDGESSLQHTHGHSHGPVDIKSEKLSSIVWMVILGDGLHNFTDGMAIGAAFSNNIAGGFSTTVAVFCHELPHELGDFAVLLKAGMSAKKAIYYNILSSILSFIGMSVGIVIGEAPETTQWVFAVAAGLFIYIALVDMMPELAAPQNIDEGFTFTQGVLQFLGMATGFATMVLIAIYEHDLQRIFT